MPRRPKRGENVGCEPDGGDQVTFQPRWRGHRRAGVAKSMVGWLCGIFFDEFRTSSKILSIVGTSFYS